MWKFVADGYEVSTDGQVRSWKSGAPRILKPAIANGYPRVSLSIDGESKFYYIHRLVAGIFLPNLENKPCVNHLNGVKTDNRVENLEWCTYAENNRHAHDTGLAAQGELHAKAKLTNDQIVHIRTNSDDLSTYALAKQFNVSQPTISNVQIGKTYRNAGGTAREPNRHTSRKFSNDVRNEIRRLYVRGSHEFGSPALAKKFGVSQPTILNIVREVSGDV